MTKDFTTYGITDNVEPQVGLPKCLLINQHLELLTKVDTMNSSF